MKNKEEVPKIMLKIQMLEQIVTSDNVDSEEQEARAEGSPGKQVTTGIKSASQGSSPSR